MARFTRVWRITRWALAAALLAAGLTLLVPSWGTFAQFGLSRGLAYPRAPHEEITFWYALPGFEAGLLLGLLLDQAVDDTLGGVPSRVAAGRAA